VLAGALIALGGQYLLRSTERKDRTSTLVLEQSALLIAWSLTPGDTAAIDSAWKAYRVAINRFIAVSSRALTSGR
jgi:hypothetical protein